MENMEIFDESKGRNRLTIWFEKKAGRPIKTIDKVFIVLMAVVFLFVFYVTLDANKYRAMVRVVDGEGKVGVNPTTEALDFGDLSRGTSAVRRVNISNGTSIPMYVIVVKTGDVSELIDISKNYFTLAPRKEEKIEFATYIPASARLDANYKGRVYLFKIPTFGL